MLVEITKSNHSAWYNNKIGEVIEVYDSQEAKNLVSRLKSSARENEYYLKEDVDNSDRHGNLRFIVKSCCKQVKLPPKFFNLRANL